MLKAAKVYLATQVTTASKGDLLVMLYDTAIKHLRQSIEKMRERDMAGKGILITKTLAIIGELQRSLDHERGGDISKNLQGLYIFCTNRLLTANIKVNPDMVQDVINVLTGLRQAFAEILPSQNGVASMTQPGAEQPAAASSATTPAPAPEPAAAEAPQPQAASPAASQEASATELAAALYVPAQVSVAAAAPAAETEKDSAKPAAPKLQPLAAPQAPAQPVSAPSMRLRAANAYATTR